MSDTPRTDMFCRTVDHTAIVGGKIYQATIETVNVSFARQLERELSDARAEIERLEKAVKVVQSAFNNYKNADAEIAKIKMREAKIEMREAKMLVASCNSDSVNSERAANAILTDEIERKDKLIEQMREALAALRKYPHTYKEAGQGCRVVDIDLNKCDAALSAAEGGRYEQV